MKKKFFRKLFFLDDPAAGAVFGWMLSIVSGFCFANLICFDDCLTVIRIRSYHFSGNPSWIIALPAITIFIIKILVTLYSLFLSLAVFFRQDKTRSKLIFYTILAAVNVIFLTFFRFDLKIAGILFSSMIWIIGFNALCLRKNNYLWYIALVFSYILLLPAGTVFIDLFHLSEVILSFGEHSAHTLFPAEWRVPLAYSAVVIFIVFFFCNIKLWASAYNKRPGELWGSGCNILLAVFALSYAAVVSAALYQQKKCANALVALEENFRHEISVNALKEIYYRNRKTDEKFHSNFNKVWGNFHKKDHDFWMVISEASRLGKLTPQQQNKFLDENAEKIGKFFDHPLPARERDYSEGKLYSMMIPDLNTMRLAAKFFSWQIRIACENKDHAKAMQAWKRSENITEYLTYYTSLIGVLVRVNIELSRLDSLEFMLSSNILSDGELAEIQQYLQKSADFVPQLNRDALYFEAVMWNDILCGIANGTLDAPAEQTIGEGVKNYRFLFPAFWYLANCNYSDLLNRFNVENLSFTDDTIRNYSTGTLISAMAIPPLKRAGSRIDELQVRYQTFMVLIEAEKHKRKTGSYPEKIPLNIIDRFNGVPLHYKVGPHTVRKSFLTKRKKNGNDHVADAFELEYCTKTIQGVGVWSCGMNQRDDNGIFGDNREDGDDLRALLTISE